MRDPWSGFIIALAGLAKAPAYMIGWKFFPRTSTQVGEYLTGLFAFGALAIA